MLNLPQISLKFNKQNTHLTVVGITFIMKSPPSAVQRMEYCYSHPANSTLSGYTADLLGQPPDDDADCGDIRRRKRRYTRKCGSAPCRQEALCGSQCCCLITACERARQWTIPSQYRRRRTDVLLDFLQSRHRFPISIRVRSSDTTTTHLTVRIYSIWLHIRFQVFY